MTDNKDYACDCDIEENTYSCGCDLGEDSEPGEEEMETIILTLDDDSELECTVIGIYEMGDDREYMALLTMEDEQVLLYKYIEDTENPDEFTLESIADEEEFKEASAAFYQLFVDEDVDEE